MAPPTTANAWVGRPSRQRRMLMLLGTLVCLWQGMAILIGPAPGSHAMSHIYPVFKPYLVAMHQNNEWGFFAPDPATGTLLRYSVHQRQGEPRVFKLTEDLLRSDPAFLRYTSLYLTIARDHEAIVDSAARHLCARHRDLDPQAIEFFMGHQRTVPPDRYLEGARPLDDEFMEIEALSPRACGSAP